MIANPKHISDVEVAIEMLGQGERDEIDIFENVEIDHIASDAGVGRVVAWIANGLDLRVLGILSVPRISVMIQCGSFVYMVESIRGGCACGTRPSVE